MFFLLRQLEERGCDAIGQLVLQSPPIRELRSLFMGRGVVSELRQRIRTARSHWKPAHVIWGAHVGQGTHVGRVLQPRDPQTTTDHNRTRSLRKNKKQQTNSPTFDLWLSFRLSPLDKNLDLFLRLLFGLRHQNFPYTSLLNMGF